MVNDSTGHCAHITSQWFVDCVFLPIHALPTELSGAGQDVCEFKLSSNGQVDTSFRPQPLFRSSLSNLACYGLLRPTSMATIATPALEIGVELPIMG